MTFVYKTNYFIVFCVCYTDLTGFSDMYCYFDVHTVSVQAGEAITLTLTANSYDANWNPVQKPVEGAVITIDGKAADCKTDADGKVTLTLENAGNALISAVSDTQILVPPVCRAEVTAPETTAPETTAPETTTTVQTTAQTTAQTTKQTTKQTTAQSVSNPASGDKSGFALLLAAAAALTGVVLTRRNHEK
ncbi:MAG: hypothetical protein II341_10155 [Oscillospiraceae bacterium]|nr:hypothetical protein [Oscillospiraceae bacterium]